MLSTTGPPGPVVRVRGWGPLPNDVAPGLGLHSIGTGDRVVADLGAADYRRCGELILAYADLGLGIVDASVVASAERLDVSTLATLDHRDFRVVRPHHCSALDLVP